MDTILPPSQPSSINNFTAPPSTPQNPSQQKVWLPIPPSVLQRLSYFIQTRKIPHLLFHGNSGTGKRTIVNQFIREIYQNDQKQIESNVMYVNCAHEKGIQFIRGEIKRLCWQNATVF
jgi:Cdc6-like AAA superfamily ATPase